MARAFLARFSTILLLFASTPTVQAQVALDEWVQRSREWAEERNRGVHARPDAGIARDLAAAARTTEWPAATIERVADELDWALRRERPAHFATMARVLVHAALDGVDLSATRERRDRALDAAVAGSWTHGVCELVDVIAVRGEVDALPVLERLRVWEPGGSGSRVRDTQARVVRALALTGPDVVDDDPEILRGPLDFHRAFDVEYEPLRQRLARAIARSIERADHDGIESVFEFVGWKGTSLHGERVALVAAVAAPKIDSPDALVAARSAALLATVEPENLSADTANGLRAALAHPEVWVRRHAFLRIASHEVALDALRRELASAIVERLMDEDAWVRSLASYASAALGPGALAPLEAAGVREEDPVAAYWMEWALARLRRPADWLVEEVLAAELLPKVRTAAEEATARAALSSDRAMKRLDAAIALLRAEPAPSDFAELAVLVDEGLRAVARAPFDVISFGPRPPRSAVDFLPSCAPLFERWLAEAAHCHGGRSYLCLDIGKCVAEFPGDVAALHAAVALHSRLHGIRAPLAAIERLGERRAVLAPFLALDFTITHLGPDRWKCAALLGFDGAPPATWENYLAAFGEAARAVLEELARHPEGRVAAAARAHLNR